VVVQLQLLINMCQQHTQQRLPRVRLQPANHQIMTSSSTTQSACW
jgi:hypothetical protein